MRAPERCLLGGQSYATIDSCVLQRNIAKLDTAFSNFWKHGRGFPQFIPRLDSFEYKPGRVILRHIRKNYATAYLPGIGLRFQLIDEYHNWFIVIEPESEDYFLDQDRMTALQKALEKYPKGLFYTFRLNETGICGRV